MIYAFATIKGMKLSQKSLVVFDLDGTLTESKSPLKADMARALAALLAKKKVAIIGGGSYEQFQNQFVGHFSCPPELFNNLFLFPTTSTSFYRYRRGGWKKVYRKVLGVAEKKKILKAFEHAFEATGYVQPKKVWGKVIEDRGTQITFSALGQDIVTALGTKKGVALKGKWNKENDALRQKMAALMRRELPDFEVRTGGLTSIDVTQKGIDKAYGVLQIEQVLKVPIRDMVFIGDALYPGGNDAAAKKTGVQTIAVKGPADTIAIIKKILNAH
jgi:HAD superfamily hydrolase (TIGR01484 family)